MQTPTDYDPPKLGYHLTLIFFAILGWFFENESRFLFNFTLITYQ